MPDAHYRRHFDPGNQSPARQGVMSNDKRTAGEVNRLAKMGLSDSNGVDIYTLKPIVTPSEEHVLPRSLGGRLAKIGLIDKRTNDRFGHDIDARLDEGLRAIRVITNAMSADGIAPRALPAVPGDDGKKYKVEAGGIMIPHPEITTTKLATGELLIRNPSATGVRLTPSPLPRLASRSDVRAKREGRRAAGEALDRGRGARGAA